MKPPTDQNDPIQLRWENLPAGIQLSHWKQSADHLNAFLPAMEREGLLLSFVNFKGELQIGLGLQPGELQSASPGLGLLWKGDQELRLLSSGPVTLGVACLFIPQEWIGLFLSANGNYKKIEQALEGDGNIITCRLGRRQLSLFSALGQAGPERQRGQVLEMQNHALNLLEYFLCSRHKNLAGVHASAAIDNEEDLTLIREVESYISEYYCSDTFTVDSILKKTYTSYHKLNFLFKSIHGMTISEYIRNKRIEKSKEMIADNVKSISQIAYEIGYSSISNYILAFKKVYRITPGKYKKTVMS